MVTLILRECIRKDGLGLGFEFKRSDSESYCTIPGYRYTILCRVHLKWIKPYALFSPRGHSLHFDPCRIPIHLHRGIIGTNNNHSCGTDFNETWYIMLITPPWHLAELSPVILLVTLCKGDLQVGGTECSLLCRIYGTVVNLVTVIFANH